MTMKQAHSFAASLPSDGRYTVLNFDNYSLAVVFRRFRTCHPRECRSRGFGKTGRGTKLNCRIFLRSRL